jgi:hypothetical protein
MNDYSDSNPPKRGTARKIYKVLKNAGYYVYDLHYNPNNWGNNPDQGYGHWACILHNCSNPDYPSPFTGWCGFARTWVTRQFVDQVILVQNRAPYSRVILDYKEK